MNKCTVIVFKDGAMSMATSGKKENYQKGSRGFQCPVMMTLDDVQACMRTNWEELPKKVIQIW